MIEVERSTLDQAPVHYRTGAGDAGSLSVEDVIAFLGRGTPRRFHSLLEGVGTLPPGFGLTRGASGRVPVRRWSASAGRTWRGSTPEQAAPLVRERLNEAFQRSVRGRRRVGVLLSGGFDSTVVAHLARGACETRCFVVEHVGRAGPKERKYAELVCQRFGLPLTVVSVGPDDLLRWAQASAQYPTPLVLWATANQRAIAEEAADQGCELLLSGLGSDEVFVGYHKKGHAAWHFRHLVEHQGVEAAWRQLLGSVRRVPNPLFYLGQCCPFSVARLKALFPDCDPGRVLTGDLHEIYSEAARRGDEGSQSAILQIEAELRSPDLLIGELNFAARLAGLPVAYPFLDRAVLETAARMPIEWLYRYGDAPGLTFRPRTKATEKYVLRLAFHDAVPPEIQVRPRMTFTVPVGRWLSQPALRSKVVTTTARSSLWRTLGCRPELVRRLLEVPPGSDPWGQPQRVWQLHLLARWWEGGGPERLARMASV